MEDKKYKIALLTAHIGHTDKPELTITNECKDELDDYGVDVYRFNNNNFESLKPFFEPTLKREEVYRESLFMKFRYWYNVHFKYKQKTYPTDEENYNRLIAKLPKMLFYKLVPNEYDYYIWCDSKFTLKEGWLGYVLGIIKENNSCQMITSKHRENSSIKQEFDYMAHNMMTYNVANLVSKYNVAEMNRQVSFYLKDKEFEDSNLYELPLIIYSKDVLKEKMFLESWYAHNYYFTIQDQLSLPYLVSKFKINIGVVNQNAFQVPFVDHNHY